MIQMSQRGFFECIGLIGGGKRRLEELFVVIVIDNIEITVSNNYLEVPGQQCSINRKATL